MYNTVIYLGACVDTVLPFIDLKNMIVGLMLYTFTRTITQTVIVCWPYTPWPWVRNAEIWLLFRIISVSTKSASVWKSSLNI